MKTALQELLESGEELRLNGGKIEPVQKPKQTLQDALKRKQEMPEYRLSDEAWD